jgi:hypothetical protein
MSDKILGEQGQNRVYWAATNQVIRRQARFLFWYYILVLLEAWVCAWLTCNYGKWCGSLTGVRKTMYLWTATKLLLPAISEWHVLLTPFLYPPEPPREVWVDVLTTVDVLYKGRVLDFFLDKEGELSGIFLQYPRRFDRLAFISDHKQGTAKDNDSYWKDIPSNNLYIPKDKIANLNVRYLTAEQVIALGASARLRGEGLSLEVEAVQYCRCTNAKHGHGNPCKSPAAENDQMCKSCHDAAAYEFGGTQHIGNPQDMPPGFS